MGAVFSEPGTIEDGGGEQNISPHINSVLPSHILRDVVSLSTEFYIFKGNDGKGRGEEFRGGGSIVSFKLKVE